jgi:Cof subfamily protein (haloacid dehalogenase superfamily)
MNIRAIAIDLDGTVLRPDASLSQRVKTALQACVRKGLQIIICTGRALTSAEPFRKELGLTSAGLEGPMVYFNGALLVDQPSGKVLQGKYLDRNVALFCARLANAKGQQYYFHAFITGEDGSGERLIANRLGPEAEIYYKRTKLQSSPADMEMLEIMPETQRCIKGMFIAEPEILNGIRPLLEEQFGDTINIARSSPYFLELVAQGVSKGACLAEALKLRGIKPEEAIAFGDEENDLPMFQACGSAAAPANARESVKSRADFVFPSNAEDGIADFLEHMIQ